MRIGHGYDAHRFCTDKKMRLGGITIPCEWGFEAHSDGDVLIHALADALLGAAGERDIGNLFPDNDPTYKNIDSRILLRRVCEILNEKNLSIDYVDVTIIAQKPKLAPYIEPMRRELAGQMQIPEERINVKATTEEKMGFTGRLEGIRVHAVCLLSE
ncbi:MAG: 2-C-methyl-D-erythritol 2,4-cyclodiphosphate synthase [Ruminococcaceae bacterium]|nr:2-C-methyl-D-erythritol 2,4-cyclodiphosphate synthase [Oscillospiraceae bacterium]